MSAKPRPKFDTKFTPHEARVWGWTVQALLNFRAMERRATALDRLRQAAREADRRHTPEEIAAAEAALQWGARP